MSEDVYNNGCFRIRCRTNIPRRIMEVALELIWKGHFPSSLNPTRSFMEKPAVPVHVIFRQAAHDLTTGTCQIRRWKHSTSSRSRPTLLVRGHSLSAQCKSGFRLNFGLSISALISWYIHLYWFQKWISSSRDLGISAKNKFILGEFTAEMCSAFRPTHGLAVVWAQF